MRGAKYLALGAALAATHLCISTATAGGHTWRINEIFSSADGSVQFIELIETCGTSGEIGMTQVTASGGTIDIANIPSGSSANKRILLGTSNLQSFGGPAPDYIIPANFISLTGGTVVYQTYHTNCSFPSGSIPTNGTSSLNRTPACGGSGCPGTVAVNSPTNFAGQSTPVTVPGCVDNDSDGYGNPGNAGCPNGSAQDCNDGNPDINPGADEICTDTLDNDCDGDADCEDSDCFDVGDEVCDDMVDNDCDALVDCDDPECLNEETGLHCIPTVSEWGVLCLGLLLTTAGSLGVRRRLGVAKAG
jgi:hypothetical protein